MKYVVYMSKHNRLNVLNKDQVHCVTVYLISNIYLKISLEITLQQKTTYLQIQSWLQLWIHSLP